MPYTEAASYNYTPMSLEAIQGGRGNQSANQGMEFARWAAQQGIDLANLARTDRNAQLGVQTQFLRDQFAAEQRQQQFQNSQTQMGFRSAEEQRRFQNEIARQAAQDAHFISQRPAPLPPEVQLYNTKMAANAEKKFQTALYNTSQGWGSYNRPSSTPRILPASAFR